ncbi:hypothetical protein ACEQPO_10010 [Bacillus sp. SL00103]
MKKKIKQLRYVQFAEYKSSPYMRRLNEQSEAVIQSYKTETLTDLTALEAFPSVLGPYTSS